MIDSIIEQDSSLYGLFQSMPAYSSFNCRSQLTR